MRWITTDGNGVVNGVFRCPQSTFPTTEVADDAVDIGWVKTNGTWGKGAALLQQEITDGNDVTKRAQLKSAIAKFEAHAATNAEAQDAIAFLLRKLL